MLGDIPADEPPKSTAKSDKPEKNLQIQSNGSIVNFNVNKKLPYKDVQYDYMISLKLSNNSMYKTNNLYQSLRTIDANND